MYPEAAEGGGSFRSAASSGPGCAWESAGSDSTADAARRARGKVRRYCAANGLNRLGTLTYRGEGCHEPTMLRRDVGRFFRGLRSEVGEPFPYVWTPEWHPGGHGLHVHFAVGRYIGQGVIRETWGRGHVFIKLLGNLPVGSGVRGEARLAARYLAKYVGKDLGTGEPGGLHRYEVAQGFQPKRVTLDGATADEVLGWAASVIGAAPEYVWRSRDEEDWAGPPAVWASWT
ncbi:MAG: hypothetical protein C0498_11140 [Anaerolinea sp.]|nr:hypothetical protein [Anaerolinea sp.]